MSTTVRRLVAFPAVLALLAVSSGCGGGGGKQVATVPVSGTVTWQGKPLADATVSFYSKEHDFLGTGVTNAEGHYELYQGAAPGENTVWISKVEGDAGASADPGENPEADPVQLQEMAGDIDEGIELQGEQLPAKFSNPDQTVLSFKVPEGGSDSADFRLSE